MFPTIINQTESLIEVECLAAGVPEPVLSWLTASYTNVSHDPDDVSIFLKKIYSHSYPFLPLLSQRIYTVNGTLYITNPVPSDSGQYICRAENSAGINQVAITIWIGEETDGSGSTHIPNPLSLSLSLPLSISSSPSLTLPLSPSLLASFKPSLLQRYVV